MTTHDDDPKREQHGEDGDEAATEPTAPATDDEAKPSTEDEVDEQLEDTFPASDPPANY